MKYRDSGMPEEAYWETLFDVPLILDRMGIDAQLGYIAELGCGFGTFTIPIAKRISGFLHTVDIDPLMVQRTRQRLDEHGITNVKCSLRDVVLDGFGVEPETQDGCLLFNILHGEGPVDLLNEARRILKVGANAYVVHWRCDPTTPRGPSMDIRPEPYQCRNWATEAKFRLASEGFVDLPPFHWGMVLRA